MKPSIGVFLGMMICWGLFIVALGKTLESIGLPGWRVGSMMIPLGALGQITIFVFAEWSK